MSRSERFQRAGNDDGPHAGAGLLAALLATVAAGPLLNHGLSAAAPLLISSLGISSSQFGLLSSLLFAVAALCSVGSGGLADRISERSQLAITFGGTILAFALAAVGPSYELLLAAVVVGGATQAIANPTTNRMIFRCVERRRRPKWVGIKQSGVQVSQVFSGFFFPAVALWLTWTGAALAALAIVAGLFIYSLRAYARASGGPEASPTTAPPVRTGGTRSGRGTGRPVPGSRIRFLTVISFLAGAGMQATNVYLAVFAHSALGFTVVVSGLGIALAGALGVASRIGWSSLLTRGVRSSTLIVFVSTAAVLSMLALAAAATASVGAAGPLFWTGVVLHGAGVLAMNVVITNAVFEVVDARGISRATGSVTMGMYAGFALGPIAMGLLVDATGGFTVGWAGAGVTYVVMLGLALWLRGTDRGTARDTTTTHS